MAETEKSKPASDAELVPPTGPLVFISHDGRDADLAWISTENHSPKS